MASEVVNSRADVFLGMNNALDPCSYEYREGMAHLSYRSRIDKAGRWDEQPALQSGANLGNDVTVIASPGGQQDGPHVKNVAVLGTNSIITGIATKEFVDAGPNKQLYSCIGDSGAGTAYIKNADGDVTPLSPPAFVTTPESSDGGESRQPADATIYYMLTWYDLTYERESLPSIIRWLAWTKLTNYHIKLTVPSPASGYELRIYRSRAVNAGSSKAVNKMFYLGKIEYQSGIPSGTQVEYHDYTSDEDIAGYEYEGRGTPPPVDCDAMAAFNERMLYFKDNVVYWSSAGRPEEVAQNYFMTIANEDAFGAHVGFINSITDNGGVVRITTVDAHSLAEETGKRVRITGTQKYDGEYEYLYVSTTVFDLVGSTFTSAEIGTSGDAGGTYLSHAGMFAEPEWVVFTKPLLSFGIYGEAKKELAELEGQKVTALFLKSGKLWVCTQALIGYVDAGRHFEDYKFRTIRKGIGAVNDKVIASTPYGMFGADRRGIWLLGNNGAIRRLSDGVVDISTNGEKATALNQSHVTDSFGVWLPELEEYVWSIRHRTNIITSISGDGTTATVLATNINFFAGDVFEIVDTDGGNYEGANYTVLTKTSSAITFASTETANETGGTIYDYMQIAYQAHRGIFVGPYTWAVSGGTNFVNEKGAQVYLVAGTDNVYRVVESYLPYVGQTLGFWFGQAMISSVKENLEVEIIYASITEGKTVTAKAYQNNIASTTGATVSNEYHHTSDNLVGVIKCHGSGRMFMVQITIPKDCKAPILAINYKLSTVPWYEKARR